MHHLPTFDPPRFTIAPTDDLNNRVKGFFSYWKNYGDYIYQYMHRLTDEITDSAGPFLTIASASTIKPLQSVQPVTGNAIVTTISTPPGFNDVTLLAVDGFTLRTGGNIAANVGVGQGAALSLFLNLKDNLWYANIGGSVNPDGSGVARGTIGVWEGYLSDVPAGWVVCDGTNDTPDLTAKFVTGSPGTEKIPWLFCTGNAVVF